MGLVGLRLCVGVPVFMDKCGRVVAVLLASARLCAQMGAFSIEVIRTSLCQCERA